MPGTIYNFMAGINRVHQNAKAAKKG